MSVFTPPASGAGQQIHRRKVLFLNTGNIKRNYLYNGISMSSFEIPVPVCRLYGSLLRWTSWHAGSDFDMEGEIFQAAEVQH